MGEQPLNVDAMAAFDNSGHLSPFNYTLRTPGSKDVLIKILYCGICHTDLHQLHNDWHQANYPMVPGHEIAGVVAKVGSQVEKFKEGDHAGVGCYVNTCRSCEACEQDLEQYCKQLVWSYNTKLPDGTFTYGGYSTHIVVDESYALKIPENLPLDAAAPLLCAGITVYSPMIYFGMTQPGKNLGVVGLGGLGHMAVKIGKAFGLKVTVISTSPHKEKEAKEGLGADFFIVSKDKEQMKKAVGTLDFIIDTVAADHPIEPLLTLLKLNGRLVIVGVPSNPLSIMAPFLLNGRKTVSGSGMGSIRETQEMLDFCAKKNVTADIEVMPLKHVNEAIKRLEKNDVKYRFVLDIADSKL